MFIIYLHLLTKSHSFQKIAYKSKPNLGYNGKLYWKIYIMMVIKNSNKITFKQKKKKKRSDEEYTSMLHCYPRMCETFRSTSGQTC